MKLSAPAASLALSLAVSAAPSPVMEVARADSPTVECIVFTKRMGSSKNHYNASCNFLAGACLDRVRGGLTDLWNHRACLAAATCQGTETLAGCANPEIAALGHEGLLITPLLSMSPIHRTRFLTGAIWTNGTLSMVPLASSTRLSGPAMFKAK
ncbi:hypothetical protein MPER_11021 [Moniliophthora perniciosa FA553]|nr:hypothetical protein MPER_11021 [Moniliophthora perniciosa FA553]